MELTVLHISESGKSALVSTVSYDANGFGGNAVTGWVPVSENFKAKKGDTLETSFKSVETRESVSEDGSVFNWLVLS